MTAEPAARTAAKTAAKPEAFSRVDCRMPDPLVARSLAATGWRSTAPGSWNRQGAAFLTARRDGQGNRPSQPMSPPMSPPIDRAGRLTPH